MEKQIAERSFFDAIVRGKPKLVEQALKSGKITDVNLQKQSEKKRMGDLPDTTGWSPLHFVAWTDNTDVASVLLDYGNSLNVNVNGNFQTDVSSSFILRS